jgi:hypothetical protein
LHSQPQVNAHSLTSHRERARVRESEKQRHRERLSERAPSKKTNRNRESESEKYRHPLYVLRPRQQICQNDEDILSTGRHHNVHDIDIPRLMCGYIT